MTYRGLSHICYQTAIGLPQRAAHNCINITRFQRTQQMNTTATKVQMQWKSAAEGKPAVRPEGPSPSFDFAWARKEKLLGPAHYLILARRRHAGRAKLSWAFRSLAN